MICAIFFCTFAVVRDIELRSCDKYEFFAIFRSSSFFFLIEYPDHAARMPHESNGIGATAIDSKPSTIAPEVTPKAAFLIVSKLTS